MAYRIPAPAPEQLAEFPGELLSGFIAAWLEFRHSSPCTTEKTSFKYFPLPKAEDMSEDDVLYGPDRELAYRKLMWAFRKCQRAHAFDRYFDAAHAQYYESATLPGLVLLKEWASEPVSAPGLYTGSFRSIRPEDYDEIWLIVRGLKAMPKNPLGNIRHVPILSPSQPLWYHYLDLKKAGKWNEGSFMADFAPKFLNEMLRPEPYAKLRELHGMTRDKAVLCACYCGNEDLCHRKLVRMILATMEKSKGETENAEKERNAPAVP